MLALPAELRLQIFSHLYAAGTRSASVFSRLSRVCTVFLTENQRFKALIDNESAVSAYLATKARRRKAGDFESILDSLLKADLPDLIIAPRVTVLCHSIANTTAARAVESLLSVQRNAARLPSTEVAALKRLAVNNTIEACKREAVISVFDARDDAERVLAAEVAIEQISQTLWEENNADLNPVELTVAYVNQLHQALEWALLEHDSEKRSKLLTQALGTFTRVQARTLLVDGKPAAQAYVSFRKFMHVVIEHTPAQPRDVQISLIARALNCRHVGSEDRSNLVVLARKLLEGMNDAEMTPKLWRAICFHMALTLRCQPCPPLADALLRRANAVKDNTQAREALNLLAGAFSSMGQVQLAEDCEKAIKDRSGN